MEMHNDHFSKIKTWLKIGLCVSALLFAFGTSNLTLAAGYELLAPIPIGGNINEASPTASVPDVNKYIENGFLLAIALAGLFAVVRIVWAGITLMSTDAVSGRSAGKEIIRDAIYGFILAIGAYAILYTVNPRLLIFNLDPGALGFSPPTFQPAPAGASTTDSIGIPRGGGGGGVIVPTPPPTGGGGGSGGGGGGGYTPPPLTSTLNMCTGKRIKPIGTLFKYGSILGETAPSLSSIRGTVTTSDTATIQNVAYILTDDGLWWDVRFDGDASDTFVLEKTPSDPTSNYICAPSGGGGGGGGGGLVGPVVVGGRVRVTNDPSVRVTGEGPGGTYLGIQPKNALGTVLSGPRYTPLTYGGSTTWWEIEYDSGPTGWSPEIDNNGSSNPPRYLEGIR